VCTIFFLIWQYFDPQIRVLSTDGVHRGSDTYGKDGRVVGEESSCRYKLFKRLILYLNFQRFERRPSASNKTYQIFFCFQGVTVTEVILSHIVVQYIVLSVQTALMMLVLFVFFDNPMVGSLVWSLSLLFLTGTSGMCYGE